MTPLVAFPEWWTNSRHSSAVVGPLTTVNQDFRDSAGQRWEYKCITAFSALNDELHGRGDQLDQYFAWCAGIGANTIRVFAIWNNLQLKPTGDDYYAALDRLITRAAMFGLRLHLVLSCDQVEGSTVRIGSGELQDHAKRVYTTVAGRPILIEGSNEDWKNGNVSGSLPYDAGLLSSRSAMPEDGTPDQYGSLLQWVSLHTSRDGQWPRKAKDMLDVAELGWDPYVSGGVHNPGWKACHKPTVGGEPMYIDGSTTPSQHADYAAVARIYAAGSCLHGSRDSIGLQNCLVPDPNSHTEVCAQAVRTTWSVHLPDDVTSWTYIRGQQDGGGELPILHQDLEDQPETGAMRSFSRTTSNQSVIVVVQPGPKWTLQPRNGWQLDHIEGNFIFMKR